MENRRRFERFIYSESVSYLGSQHMDPVGSLSEDISQNGLKLNVNEFIPLNSLLEIQFKMPTYNQVVQAFAKVVWVRESPKCIDGWQVGIEIFETKESFSELESFIKLLKHKAY